MSWKKKFKKKKKKKKKKKHAESKIDYVILAVELQCPRVEPGPGSWRSNSIRGFLACPGVAIKCVLLRSNAFTSVRNQLAPLRLRLIFFIVSVLLYELKKKI